MARSVSEVGPGDYVKIGRTWEKIISNSAYGQPHPRSWTIETEQGTYDMYGINAYAKAEEVEQ